MDHSWASAVVLIPDNPAALFSGADLQPGDQIAAIGPDGLCVGISEWDSTGTALTLWADDPDTEALDGLNAGDVVSFAVYPPDDQGRPVTSIAFTFQTALAPNEGFEPDGVYVVSRAEGPALDANDAVPESGLGLVRPNPVVQSAQIPLSLATAGRVRVDVIDALGRRVATLLDGPLDAGDHVLPLDASMLASGTYVCQVRSDGGLSQRRFTVTR